MIDVMALNNSWNEYLNLKKTKYEFNDDWLLIKMLKFLGDFE